MATACVILLVVAQIWPHSSPNPKLTRTFQGQESSTCSLQSGMAQRESSFELLGVDLPEPEERLAQGRPPVDGTRERLWRQQDEV